MNERSYFKNILYNNTYMPWLAQYMENKRVINLETHIQNPDNTEYEKDMLSFIEFLFLELIDIHIRQGGGVYGYIINAFLEYEDYLYEVIYDGSYYCLKYKKEQLRKNENGEYLICTDRPFINYKTLLTQYAYDYYRTVANSLSYDEVETIKNNLIGRNCLNCTNPMCRIPHKEKFGYYEDGTEIGSSCLMWENQKIIGASKVFCIKEISKLG